VFDFRQFGHGSTGSTLYSQATRNAAEWRRLVGMSAGLRWEIRRLRRADRENLRFSP
jgi:hypothetical protein